MCWNPEGSFATTARLPLPMTLRSRPPILVARPRRNNLAACHGFRSRPRTHCGSRRALPLAHGFETIRPSEQARPATPRASLLMPIVQADRLTRIGSALLKAAGAGGTVLHVVHRHADDV